LPSNERVGRMSSGWSTAMRKSSSSKGVLTGVALTQRGVVLGRINCGGKSKRRLEFGINEQHKTRVDLDRCKVRRGGAKKKDTRTRSQRVLLS
jgi:hypothetical protein